MIELPWNDLTTDSNGLMASEREKRAVDWNCFALDFISPSGIVTQAFNTKLKVSNICSTVGFAIVQSFQTLFVYKILIHLASTDELMKDYVSFLQPSKRGLFPSNLPAGSISCLSEKHSWFSN